MAINKVFNVLPVVLGMVLPVFAANAYYQMSSCSDIESWYQDDAEYMMGEMGCYNFSVTPISGRTSLSSWDSSKNIGIAPCLNGYQAQWDLYPVDVHAYGYAVLFDGANGGGGSTAGTPKACHEVGSGVWAKYYQFYCRTCNENFYSTVSSASGAAITSLNWSYNQVNTNRDAAGLTSLGSRDFKLLGGTSCTTGNTGVSSTIPSVSVSNIPAGTFATCSCDSTKCTGADSVRNYTKYKEVTYRTCGTDEESFFYGCLLKRKYVCQAGYYATGAVSSSGSQCVRCPQYQGSYDKVSSRSYNDSDSVTNYGVQQKNGSLVYGISNCYVTSATEGEDDTGYYTESNCSGHE